MLINIYETQVPGMFKTEWYRYSLLYRKEYRFGRSLEQK